MAGLGQARLVHAKRQVDDLDGPLHPGPGLQKQDEAIVHTRGVQRREDVGPLPRHPPQAPAQQVGLGLDQGPQPTGADPNREPVHPGQGRDQAPIGQYHAMGIQTGDQEVLDVLRGEGGDLLGALDEALLQQGLEPGVAPPLLLGGRHPGGPDPGQGRPALGAQPAEPGAGEVMGDTRQPGVEGAGGDGGLQGRRVHAASSPAIQP